HHLPAPSLFTIFFSLTLRPPRSPLFPYTTLFRSMTGHLNHKLLRYIPGASYFAMQSLLSLLAPMQMPPNEFVIHFFAFVVVLWRSEEHTSELQSRFDLVCRLLLEKKRTIGLVKQT